MKLRDVADLEAQLALDEGQDDAVLRARDRGIYLALAPVPSAPDSLLSAWLEALRARFGAPRLGEQVEAAQRVLSYGLVLLGVSMGWGSAEVLLHFEQGGAPVNLGYYLLVLVFGQLAMLLLMVLSFALRRMFSRLPVFGDLLRLMRYLSERVQRLLAASPKTAERLQAERVQYERVRARLGLYSDVERYALLSQTQLLGLAFNIGALVCCVRIIVFSDLAFSWSTSISAIDAAQVQRVCALLSWPFAWFLPEAVPSDALIANTQYFRLEGRFSGAAAGTRGNAALVGEWWRFLIACTITYGLLPRLGTFLWFRRRLARACEQVPLDTPLVQRVLARLTTPELSTRAPLRPVDAPAAAGQVSPAAPLPAGTSTLVLYRDIPTSVALLSREVERQLGVRVVDVQRAGGFDARAEGSLRGALAGHVGSVCVVAEAWEAPDKSLRGLLATLRELLGPRQSLHVVLLGEAHEHGFGAPSPDDVRTYRDRLTLLADPYLSVEVMPPTREDEPAREERA